MIYYSFEVFKQLPFRIAEITVHIQAKSLVLKPLDAQIKLRAGNQML